ncbi:hypothetical protein V1514DRAFT_328334 [Lipomyces japonicus]|uniref:uncharacterized protein n=1 Tax=Lipomyces japonicus TaxID=56871 RepID=UPI0034CEE678
MLSKGFYRMASSITPVSSQRASELASNLAGIKDRVASAAAQAGQTGPRLVAVSKLKPAEDILWLHSSEHQDHFGENYVQELVDKAARLPDSIQWHFIGTLQTAKCKTLAQIPNLYAVETVEAEKRAKKLNDNRPDGFPKLNVFVQVNTSGEAEKSGVTGNEAVELAKYIVTECPRLRFKGLMTIGSKSQSEAAADGIANQDFKNLVEIRDKIETQLRLTGLELSMGMSEDFEDAIRQGSTNVRVGSSIFGARALKDAS